MSVPRLERTLIEAINPEADLSGLLPIEGSGREETMRIPCTEKMRDMTEDEFRQMIVGHYREQGYAEDTNWNVDGNIKLVKEGAKTILATFTIPCPPLTGYGNWEPLLVTATELNWRQ